MVKSIVLAVLLSQAGVLRVQNAGSTLGWVNTLNFSGAGATCSRIGNTYSCSFASGGGSGLPSDPAACPAHQLVYDQNASGVLSCRQPDWTDLTAVPTTFAPSAHTHVGSDVTSTVVSSQSAQFLALAPAKCGAGVAAIGINAFGDAQGCFTPVTGAPTTAHYVTTQAEAGLSAEAVLPTCTGTDKLTFNGTTITCATDQSSSYTLPAATGVALGGVIAPTCGAGNHYSSISAGTLQCTSDTGGVPPDATTTSKGVVQLAGDLAGTATVPTVPGLAAKAPLASPSFTGTVTSAGNLALSGAAPSITATTVGESLRLVGNVAATGAASDVIIDTSRARSTAGNLFDVRNNGGSAFSIDTLGRASIGGGQLYANQITAPPALASGVLITDGLAAASPGTSLALDTGANRSAGSLFDVRNQGTSKFTVAWDGTVTLAVPLGAAAGGLGAAQPTCAAGQHVSCDGTSCSCTADTTGAHLLMGSSHSDVDTAATSASDIIWRNAGNTQWVHVPIANALPTCSGTGDLTANGSLVTCARGVTTVMLTQDRSTTSTTGATTTDLTWPILASGTHSFSCTLTHVGTATSLTRFAVSTPSSPTTVAFQYDGSTTSATALVGGTVAGAWASTCTNCTPAVTASALTSAITTLVVGTVVNGVNGGSVVIFFASSTSGQTNTLKKGSSCSYSIL